MAYTILHLSRNNQRTHLIVDDVTTLPVMFATIYGMNELSKKSLGTQENILVSLFSDDLNNPLYKVIERINKQMLIGKTPTTLADLFFIEQKRIERNNNG